MRGILLHFLSFSLVLTKTGLRYIEAAQFEEREEALKLYIQTLWDIADVLHKDYFGSQ